MRSNLQKELFNKKFQNSNGSVDETESIEEERNNDTLCKLSYVPRSNLIKQLPNNDDSDVSLPSWKDFFDYNIGLKIPERGFQFNIYYTLPTNFDAKSIPIFFFHHGAGSSGMTFASLANELFTRLENKCGLVSFDARGHGQTQPIDHKKFHAYDLDSYTLDFSNILIRFLYDFAGPIIEDSKISIVFVGHSLGGSICTKLHHILDEEIRAKVVGVAMFDIVEEVALAALNKMKHFITSTPNTFENMEEAINYHINRGLIKQRSKAEISVPPLFRETPTKNVKRITDLASFSPYWDTWFVSLSSNFVSLTTGKLLILAGNDNLDRELIIGHMQGKYQLVIFQDSGHFIQEDAPAKTAHVLIDFWHRNCSKNTVVESNWGKRPTK